MNFLYCLIVLAGNPDGTPDKCFYRFAPPPCKNDPACIIERQRTEPKEPPRRRGRNVR